MKRLLLLTMSVLMLTGIGTASAASLREGTVAYMRGDYPEALKVFKALAAQGNGQAQTNLGAMYDKGQGVPKDYAEAAKWYRLAAAQGVASAQFNLGAMYDKGQGVTKDDAEAMKWYRLAAAQGIGQAQSNIGVMYVQGQGVPQDYVRAYMWFELAAMSGEAEAIKNRDISAKRITPPQIAEAQKLARDCQQRNFKGCD